MLTSSKIKASKCRLQRVGRMLSFFETEISIPICRTKWPEIEEPEETQKREGSIVSCPRRTALTVQRSFRDRVSNTQTSGNPNPEQDRGRGGEIADSSTSFNRLKVKIRGGRCLIIP